MIRGSSASAKFWRSSSVSICGWECRIWSSSVVPERGKPSRKAGAGASPAGARGHDAASVVSRKSVSAATVAAAKDAVGVREGGALAFVRQPVGGGEIIERFVVALEPFERATAQGVELHLLGRRELGRAAQQFERAERLIGPALVQPAFDLHQLRADVVGREREHAFGELQGGSRIAFEQDDVGEAGERFDEMRVALERLLEVAARRREIAHGLAGCAQILQRPWEVRVDRERCVQRGGGLFRLSVGAVDAAEAVEDEQVSRRQHVGALQHRLGRARLCGLGERPAEQKQSLWIVRIAREHALADRLRLVEGSALKRPCRRLEIVLRHFSFRDGQLRPRRRAASTCFAEAQAGASSVR